jgi:hypothetical protein
MNTKIHQLYFISRYDNVQSEKLIEINKKTIYDNLSMIKFKTSKGSGPDSTVGAVCIKPGKM